MLGDANLGGIRAGEHRPRDGRGAEASRRPQPRPRSITSLTLRRRALAGHRTAARPAAYSAGCTGWERSRDIASPDAQRRAGGLAARVPVLRDAAAGTAGCAGARRVDQHLGRPGRSLDSPTRGRRSAKNPAPGSARPRRRPPPDHPGGNAVTGVQPRCAARPAGLLLAQRGPRSAGRAVRPPN